MIPEKIYVMPEFAKGLDRKPRYVTTATYVLAKPVPKLPVIECTLVKSKVENLAYAMYPKDEKGYYEQRDDWPEYIRMAHIAYNELIGEN
jgi:hypothetical protein